MLKMIAFVISMATANVIGGFILTEIMMKKFMNKAYLKEVTKMTMEAGEEVFKEMESKDEKEEA